MADLHIVPDHDRRREVCLVGASLLSDLLSSIEDPDMRERADAVRQDLLLASLPDGGVDYRGITPRRGDPMTLDEAQALVGKTIACRYAGRVQHMRVAQHGDHTWPSLFSTEHGQWCRRLGPWIKAWIEVDR